MWILIIIMIIGDDARPTRVAQFATQAECVVAKVAIEKSPKFDRYVARAKPVGFCFHETGKRVGS